MQLSTYLHQFLPKDNMKHASCNDCYFGKLILCFYICSAGPMLGVSIEGIKMSHIKGHHEGIYLRFH